MDIPDIVEIDVSGKWIPIRRGAKETLLPDGRRIVAGWGGSPPTLIWFKVFAASSERHVRATDRTATALRAMLDAYHVEHVEAQISCACAYEEGQRRILAARVPYEHLAAVLGSYVSCGDPPLRDLDERARRLDGGGADGQAMADYVRAARSRLAAALAAP